MIFLKTCERICHPDKVVGKCEKLALFSKPNLFDEADQVYIN